MRRWLSFWLRRVIAWFWAPLAPGWWCVHGRWLDQDCQPCLDEAAAWAVEQS